MKHIFVSAYVSIWFVLLCHRVSQVLSSVKRIIISKLRNIKIRKGQTIRCSIHLVLGSQVNKVPNRSSNSHYSIGFILILFVVVLFLFRWTPITSFYRTLLSANQLFSSYIVSVECIFKIAYCCVCVCVFLCVFSLCFYFFL